MVSLFLLVLAAVLFLIGSFSGYYVSTVPAGTVVPFYHRVNYISLGLFCYILSMLVGHAGVH